MVRKIDKELSKRLKGRKFKIGHCYSNSFKVLDENKDKNIEHWVIGYCKHKDSFKSFRHGWNLNKDGEIVDVTLATTMNITKPLSLHLRNFICQMQWR